MAKIDTKQPLICVVGPTGVGKSEMAKQIAKRVDGEVISADSMQIYQGMDIGTAKLRVEEMEGVMHHLLDVANPLEPFTVAMWKKMADAVIDELHKQGKIPIACGGTGLYIRALTDDLDFTMKPDTTELRRHYEAYAAEHGNDALYRLLQTRDAARAEQLHPNDVRRVVRALEVLDTTQATMSQHYDWSYKAGRYAALQIGLRMDRAALYARVNARVERMWAEGLVDEVKRLMEQGVTPLHTSLQAIGYKEVVAMIAGEVSEVEAMELVKRNTRRYVKRQMSWFLRDPRIHWFELDNSGRMINGEWERLWLLTENFVEGKTRIRPE